jgi:RNA 3'-phosphate cyclase
MIILDGTHGEGGGQILRTALVLSLLTDQPFRIENIRAGRPNPGLKPQHLHILKALQQMGEIKAEGVQPGALTVTFWPGRLQGGDYHFDIGTAGAIPLFLQTMLPVAMFIGEPVTFTVTGGTDVRGAMTIDFWREILLPFLRPYAAQLALTVEQYGYYPVGGGRVHVAVTPYFDQINWRERRGGWPALTLQERGTLQEVRLLSLASRQLRERRVTTRQAAAFTSLFSKPLPTTQLTYVDTRSPGSSITAIAEFAHTRLGADALGDKGKSSEQVGQEAAQRLQAEVTSDATVDVHSADNLMLWVALFGGSYRFAHPTGHITTNAWVIEQFLPSTVRLVGNQVLGWRTQ